MTCKHPGLKLGLAAEFEARALVWKVLGKLGSGLRRIMFRRGIPKEAICRMSGHHSWEFTAGTYLHFGDDDPPYGAVIGDLTMGVTPPLSRALRVVSS
jgi:hypothetical protein